MGVLSDEDVLALARKLDAERKTILDMKKELNILGRVMGLEPPCVSVEILMGIKELQKKLGDKP